MTFSTSSFLKWYIKNQRILPWREDPTPYHVYLSEMMLQQTQVKKVLPYYIRFLEAYPSIDSLASATLKEVNLLWQGLGYYSRAKNLLEGAKTIAKIHSFPHSKEDLLKISGIGEYTAKAICAIAFHQKEIAVDGNLIRVYSRFQEDKEKNLSLLKRNAEAFFKKALQKEDPSSFNQALMDLGEMVCLPNGMPLCVSCPLKEGCKAYKHSTQLLYPPKKEKKERKQVDMTVLLFRYQDKIFIHKREDKGLLASLYEYLNVPKELEKSELERNLKEHGILFSKILSLRKEKHAFSHILWKMTPYRIETEALDIPYPGEWIALKDLGTRYPMPSAFKKIKIEK